MASTDGTWHSETRLLFRVALGVFTVTVLIGMLNGFHFFNLPRNVVLTHVHAGTIGWITLSAFAAAYWLYGGGDTRLAGHARGVAIGAAICVPLYVAGFLSGNFVARAVTGTPVLLLMVGMVVLMLRGRGSVRMSTARVGVLLAFTALLVGSTLGVLIQVQLAISHTLLPDGAITGHVAAQVAGYLALVSLSIIDWRLGGSDDFGWGGRVQVGLLFAAGLLVAVGALFNIPPLLAVFIPLELGALVIFMVRAGARVVGARWLEPGSSRHYAIALPWLVVNLAITIYFLQIGIAKGFGAVPVGLFTAADHAMFLGVMTNLIFGLIQDFTTERRSIVPWTENVVFWVLNIALVGFVVALITEAQWAEKFFVPFQGLAILLGIVVYSMRLAGPAAPPEAASS